MEDDNWYPAEPIGIWLIDDFNQFLIWGSKAGASDVHLVPGRPIWIRVDGNWRSVTRRDLTTTEISGLLDLMARSPDASARLTGGVDIDSSYEVREDRLSSFRFRWNASACRDGWSRGVTVVMRSIPALPPKLKELGVEQAILDHCFHKNGLILVTGVMGSGKSTLLSSILREIIETDSRSVKTFESPIEFDLMAIQPNDGCGGPVTQHEIPEHFKEFKQAGRNTTRCASDVVLIGESRDTETLRSMLEMSEVGVAAYSTVHTRGVAETPSRIINVFPNVEHNQIAALLASSLKMIIYQRLLPKVGGGRIAVKEFLAIDTGISDILSSTSPGDFKVVMQSLLEKHGVTLIEDVRAKHAQGLISDDTFREIQHQYEVQYVD